MNVSNVWYNELGSVMEIKFSNGIITGTYETKVGDAQGLYKLAGLYDNKSDNEIALGWVVVWLNDGKNSKCATSWSGELRYTPEEGPVIFTTWLLTAETNHDNDWKSTLVGRDKFTPNKPSSEPLALSNTASSHPMRPLNIATAGCWVTFYEDENFGGRVIKLDGPAQFNNLKHLPGDENYDWGDKFGSLRTGPNAWVTLYNDEDFNDDHFTFGPGSEIRKLSNDDDTDSLKIFDADPHS